MQVDVVSPEENLFSGECTQVLARSAGGDIAFLSDHAPYIGALEIGALRLWLSEGGQTAIAIRGGFVEVSSNTVTILSDIAAPADRIDVDQARADLAEAQAKGTDDENALVDARWAEAQIRVATGDFGS